MKKIITLLFFSIITLPAFGYSPYRVVSCDVKEHREEVVTFFFSKSGSATAITIFDKYASGGNIVGRFVLGDGTETSDQFESYGVAVVNFKTISTWYGATETTADATFIFYPHMFNKKMENVHRTLLNCADEKNI
jgi:hypothetical protein